MKTNPDKDNRNIRFGKPGEMPAAVGSDTFSGGDFDKKREPAFPESTPIYTGHAAVDFDASRQGAVRVKVTDSGVSNANVDEFTTGGNSLGHNVGASRDDTNSTKS